MCLFRIQRDTKIKVAFSRRGRNICLGCNDCGRYTEELIGSKIVLYSVQVAFDENSFPVLRNSSSYSSGECENNWSGSEKIGKFRYVKRITKLKSI